jgi:hypothetical protein
MVNRNTAISNSGSHGPLASGLRSSAGREWSFRPCNRLVRSEVRPAGTGFAPVEPDPSLGPAVFDAGTCSDAVAAGPREDRGREGVGVGLGGARVPFRHSVGIGGVGGGPVSMLGRGVGRKHGSEEPKALTAGPTP